MPVPLAIFKISYVDTLIIEKLSLAMRFIIKDFALVFASISIHDVAFDL
jgi:hypothetical protein